MPALRPFWRVLHGKFSSYKSSSYDKDRPNSNTKPSGSSDVHLPTIGSVRNNARKGPIVGPYSVELRGGNSEENLEAGLKGIDPSKRGEDTDSIQVVLPKQVISKVKIGRDFRREVKRKEEEEEEGKVIGVL